MLNQQERDQKVADKVNALLIQASALRIDTTRRQARKMLQGRGHLAAKIREAERIREQAQALEGVSHA